MAARRFVRVDENAAIIGTLDCLTSLATRLRSKKRPVGAGLFAKAVYQSHRCWMCRRLREQARSHRFLRCLTIQVIYIRANACARSARRSSTSSTPTDSRTKRVADAQLRAGFGRNGGVGHDRRVLDQAFDAAQALGQREDLHVLEKAPWRRPGRCSGRARSCRRSRASGACASACCGCDGRPG